MKYLIVVSSCILAVLGRPQSSQYGAPSLLAPSSSSRGSLLTAARAISSSSGGIRNNINAQQSFSLASNSNAGGYAGNSLGGNSGGIGGQSSLPDGPKVFKHISIHVPPMDEFEEPTRRIIRPMMAPDKHVNIIFVKAPSMSSNQQTEVILPAEPERKTVVYILVKKRNSQNDVKIRQPSPTRPPKPEVYFIKYARGAGAGGAGASAAGQGGQEGQSLGQVGSRPEYGVPS